MRGFEGLPAPFLIYSRLTWIASVGWLAAMVIDPTVYAGVASLGLVTLALFALFYSTVPPVPWPISLVIIGGGLVSAVAVANSTGGTIAEGFAVAAYLLAVVASRPRR